MPWPGSCFPHRPRVDDAVVDGARGVRRRVLRLGGQVGANALSAAYYPTASRATGVSWANGVGRIGSVPGSMLGGFMLSLGWGLPTVFGIRGDPRVYRRPLHLRHGPHPHANAGDGRRPFAVKLPLPD